ncbi:MAG: PhoH family protein [Candidatus Latescibacteria bacterium]|nr:PhoH family protein [bacterium]MBD3424857.1 PhoH family protein [Candidatus Latescibacterota bacterium]
MNDSGNKRALSIKGIDLIDLLGINDANLKILEEYFPGAIVVRGSEVILKGEAEKLERLTDIFKTLIGLVESGHRLTGDDITRVIEGGKKESKKIDDLKKSVVYYSTRRRKAIAPKTTRQKKYVDAIREFDVVFAIGPAGTGKTFLAIASALEALKRGEIERIFISRPVVETGEKLGFLPGDLKEKIDPYLRPIFDSFTAMIGLEKLQHMIETGAVEIAPLAYMRGRTLNNSFAILDEAQNSTVMQMKMFLTRLGINSKAIVTGDITQIDLAGPEESGLVAVQEILDGVAGVSFIFFSEEDVVRHQLVKRIIRAFSMVKSRGDEPEGKGASPPDDSGEAPRESEGRA